MITDIVVFVILGLIVGALLVYIHLTAKEVSKERQKFINALIARNAREMQELEYTEKVQPKEERAEPDLVSVESLTDEEWSKSVLGEDNG